MRKRRFVCTPADLSRYESRVVALMDDNPRCVQVVCPKNSLLEFVYAAMQMSLDELYHYRIRPDRDTRLARYDLLKHASLFNLHMFQHHVTWQLLESYDARNPRMNLVDHAKVDRWRRATEDCIQE